ncbi:MAG: DUF6042 family protein [Bacillota bacterium]|jgi:hypothetical protein
MPVDLGMDEVERAEQYSSRGENPVERFLPGIDNSLGTMAGISNSWPNVPYEVISTSEEERTAAMWTALPQVRQLLSLGWHRHLPPEAGMTFTSIVILWWSGCKGKEMWEWLSTWHTEGKNYKPDPRQACAKEDVERRFAAEYGKPYKKTLRGLIQLLIDLGLVSQSKCDGEDVLEIPDLLPLPEDVLKLSKAERAYLKVIREEHTAALREQLKPEIEKLRAMAAAEGTEEGDKAVEMLDAVLRSDTTD